MKDNGKTGDKSCRHSGLNLGLDIRPAVEQLTTLIQFLVGTHSKKSDMRGSGAKMKKGAEWRWVVVCYISCTPAYLPRREFIVIYNNYIF